MRAIAFDYETREIQIVNGKTVITENPSVQNGMIILNTNCINPYKPDLGIAFNPINSQQSSVNFELNRWKNQCLKDGAKVANFTATSTGVSNVATDITYELKY